MKIRHELVGAKFGFLTVAEFAGVKQMRHSRALWLCSCHCGASRTVDQNHLLNGQVTSCGCGNGNPASYSITHKREYGVWASMKQRCLNPNNENYHKYGARGIKVCEQWMDFAGFYADMGPRPEGTTIDRINNDGNYEPGNCRWAVPSVQASNTRATRYVTYNGVSRTLTQWAELYGVKFGTFRQRIEKGWPVEAALTRAPRPGKSEAPKDHRKSSADVTGSLE